MQPSPRWGYRKNSKTLEGPIMYPQEQHSPPPEKLNKIMTSIIIQYFMTVLRSSPCKDISYKTDEAFIPCRLPLAAGLMTFVSIIRMTLAPNLMTFVCLLFTADVQSAYPSMAWLSTSSTWGAMFSCSRSSSAQCPSQPITLHFWH